MELITDCGSECSEVSWLQISGDDKRMREAPAAYPLTVCALVWASVHGPEPHIYTHRPRASRTDWPDVPAAEKGEGQGKKQSTIRESCMILHRHFFFYTQMISWSFLFLDVIHPLYMNQSKSSEYILSQRPCQIMLLSVNWNLVWLVVQERLS